MANLDLKFREGICLISLLVWRLPSFFIVYSVLILGKQILKGVPHKKNAPYQVLKELDMERFFDKEIYLISSSNGDVKNFYFSITQ